MYPSKQVNEQLFYENKQAIAFPTSPEATDFIRFWATLLNSMMVCKLVRALFDSSRNSGENLYHTWSFSGFILTLPRSPPAPSSRKSLGIVFFSSLVVPDEIALLKSKYRAIHSLLTLPGPCHLTSLFIVWLNPRVSKMKLNEFRVRLGYLSG